MSFPSRSPPTPSWPAGSTRPGSGCGQRTSGCGRGWLPRDCRRSTAITRSSSLAASSPWTQTISRLRCLRGIDTLSALGLCAEIGEFDRFEHPDSLSAYLGIVPSENTTGQQRQQGSITKARSTHARRLLIEASYHYQRNPAIGLTLERRQRGQSPDIVNIAWRAQRRLNARWRTLKHARKKPNGVVAVAIARELRRILLGDRRRRLNLTDNPWWLARRPDPSRHRAQQRSASSL